MKSNIQKGFTLIELMVVISIVTLLSSIVFASVNIAHSKAIDARKKVEVAQVEKALLLYEDTHGGRPPDFLVGGVYNSAGGGDSAAVEDLQNPTSPGNVAYEASMQLLVNDGLIPQIPRSPGNQPYAYFHGTFFTQSELAQDGMPNSCNQAVPFYQCGTGYFPSYPGHGQGCYPYGSTGDPNTINACEYSRYEGWMTSEQYSWCRNYILTFDYEEYQPASFNQQHIIDIFGSNNTVNPINQYGEADYPNVGIKPCGFPNRGEICSCQ
jgi:prepilin-type N-terminal cleavage/methylation domain-containing protein